MFVRSFCSTVSGIDAQLITVEVNICAGLQFVMVGLADNAVRESQQRIISAFSNNKLKMPGSRITINLAPADMRKEGSHYDLPIAVGILAASGQIPSDLLSQFMIIGELSLDGSILPVKGALPIAISALSSGFRGIIVPKENAHEAAVVTKLEVYGVENIMQVIDLLRGGGDLQRTVVDTRADYFSRINSFDVDFSDVRGQAGVKRALEIAAAGGHNVIMVGPPGSGKSMLASRMSTITPPMTLGEALEVTKIHSVAGRSESSGGLVNARPFRAPHHIISDVALVGGGNTPQPGEISLAHNGILFLDEMPEFSRHVLEVLRQPLEERRITISRARYNVCYPANFMLIGAMNPCPCGYLTHPDKECTCSPSSIHRYIHKISGPLMDRIDMHIEITPVNVDSLTSSVKGESSAVIRERVISAREIQNRRLADYPDIHSNAMLTPSLMAQFCVLDSSCVLMIKEAMTRLNLSARAYDRIIKVSRTIADLEQSEQITVSHIAEAITFRALDRESWGQTFA
ncbi:MAG: YifB family Mg chelatase-like AAA ATPase [Rikenellaceae bacterium]